MTIGLHYYGGPKDGGFTRTASRDHVVGEPIVVTGKWKHGYYTSIAPWDGIEKRVSVEWFYGTPEFHEEMKRTT